LGWHNQRTRRKGVKKFIKNIVYSKEQIELSLFYSKLFGARAKEALPSREQRDIFLNEKRTPSISAKNPQFVLSSKETTRAQLLFSASFELL